MTMLPNVNVSLQLAIVSLLLSNFIILNCAVYDIATASKLANLNFKHRKTLTDNLNRFSITNPPIETIKSHFIGNSSEFQFSGAASILFSRFKCMFKIVRIATTHQIPLFSSSDRRNNEPDSLARYMCHRIALCIVYKTSANDNLNMPTSQVSFNCR